MAQRRMADARVLINGAFYATQEIEWDTEVERIDTSNTENLPGNPLLGAGALKGGPGPARSALPDIPGARGTIRNMTWDETQSPYATPFFVSAGVYFTLQIFPSGAGVNQSLGPINCLCLATSHRGVVGQGGQPVTIRWCSDGEYNLDVD